MAKGVTAEQVAEAAERVMARGERPTIERVRHEIGSGSPNTVNKYLETWWRALASRLATGDGRWPPAVERACQALWREALAAAQAAAQSGLEAERATLRQEADASGALRGHLEMREKALEQAQSLLETDLRDLRNALAKAQAEVRESETMRAAGDKALANAERAIAKLTSQLEAAQVRLDGNQKHAAERYAAREVEHDREVRRLRAEMERVRGRGKADQAALSKAQRELAASQGELLAVRRSEEQLRARLIVAPPKRGRRGRTAASAATA